MEKSAKKTPKSFKFSPQLNQRLVMVSQKLGIRQTAIVEAGTRKLLDELERTKFPF